MTRQDLRKPDLICFSHLRWNFVFQRPNHLMARCARERRVFFVEEPLEGEQPSLAVREVMPNLCVVTPWIRRGADAGTAIEEQRAGLEELRARARIESAISWFYTPMALEFARDFPHEFVVYDCMDELSGFDGAPAKLRDLELELFDLADVVFTGGRSLFEAKSTQHTNVHLFPSSVDAEHYRTARKAQEDPPDQAAIAHPRIGFFGVIDERMDLELLASLADARPQLQLVMIGPVVKIPNSSLPRRPNIHYLGQKQYEELPRYLANWDAAFMPFALNDATRFISPTKTLEYLAGGKPVVSTAIRDVVTPYGEQGLVYIADAARFPAAADKALSEDFPEGAVDTVLEGTSWEATWQRMSAVMDEALSGRSTKVA
jgi:glycosyltransferase involved in cell wall biosynthesis